MIVDPYKRTPQPPTVALLWPTDDTGGTRHQGYQVIDETGSLLDLETMDADVRVWAFYDHIHELVKTHGEALCWNTEEIRWRHARLDPVEVGWRSRRSDVSVVKLPPPDRPDEALAALTAWRDWLAGYGAAPTGTTGSAAWSLLRARLDRRLWTSVGQLPPIPWTLGGRQQLGPHGKGSFPGKLELLDLPAAYASELGHLPYGGRWLSEQSLPVVRSPEWWAQEGRPVYVRAKVSIPRGLQFGPLPRRPRKRLRGLAAAMLQCDYPTGTTIQGCWTWQELQNALSVGCKVQKQLGLWVHLPSGQPFLPWWDAIVAGRRAHGLAGALAKMTGNALWGRFCMDSTGGARTIRGRAHGRLQSRPAPRKGGLPAAHDLAETVSGRVRAKLHRVMFDADELLLSAHTDGAWLREGMSTPDGWRLKETARQLDVLDPQVLRYWQTGDPDPHVVFAGIPAEDAPRVFQEQWEQGGYA